MYISRRSGWSRRSNQSRRSRRKKRKAPIILVFLGILVLFFIFLKEEIKYKNVFFNGTVINGVDCSLLTVKEAKEAIDKNYEEYEIEIIFKASKEKISGKEISFGADNIEEELIKLKESQNINLKNLFIKKKGEMYNLDFSYDGKYLKEILSNMTELKEKYMKKSTKIVYNEDRKKFEENSYYLNLDDVIKNVSKAIEEHKNEVYIDSYVNKSNLEKINLYVRTKITYQLPSGEYILEEGEIHKWLEEGSSLKKNVNEFVEKLSSLTDNVGKKKKFSPTDANDVFVFGGEYGYQLDKEAEIQKLTKEIKKGMVVSREPCYQKRELTKTNNGIGTSYVEIDLNRQKVWVYVNGEKKVETECVTGCVSKGYETPTGIYLLTYKQIDRTLRGEKQANGKYEYESHVNYWMPFNGNIGLHDATWRASFGGNIYVTNGSHGCINLPLKKAKEIYNMINGKMPIIVYKSK